MKDDTQTNKRAGTAPTGITEAVLATAQRDCTPEAFRKLLGHYQRDVALSAQESPFGTEPVEHTTEVAATDRKLSWGRANQPKL